MVQCPRDRLHREVLMWKKGESREIFRGPWNKNFRCRQNWRHSKGERLTIVMAIRWHVPLQRSTGQLATECKCNVLWLGKHCGVKKHGGNNFGSHWKYGTFKYHTSSLFEPLHRVAHVFLLASSNRMQVNFVCCSEFLAWGESQAQAEEERLLNGGMKSENSDARNGWGNCNMGALRGAWKSPSPCRGR